MLQEIHSKPNEALDCAPVSAEFESEVIPEYETAEFVLKNYTE
jgi:hypothetical protein